MLCVGEPVTERATGEFLTYFARQATTYGTQRIGLTSPNRRVVPLTRDYQYAAGKFGDFAQAAKMPEDVAEDMAASFSPPVRYVDYAPSVEDILALCMTGFPSFEHKSTHRRSLIYLGPSTIRGPGETRPSLFSDQRATDMAAAAGIQINVVSPSGQEQQCLADDQRIDWRAVFPNRSERPTTCPHSWTASVAMRRIPRCLVAPLSPAGSGTRRRSRWR